MQNTKVAALRIILWSICIYHIIAGLIGSFFQDMVPFVSSLFYGIETIPSVDNQLFLVYLGTFCLTFGVLTGLAAKNPFKNRYIIWGAICYFALRAIDRIIYWNTLNELNVGFVPNWLRIVIILAYGISLFLLLPRSDETNE